MVFVVEPIYYAVPDFAGAAYRHDRSACSRSSGSSGKEQLERLQARYAKHRIKLRALLQTGTPYQAIVDSAKHSRPT